jgi:hypothetical protein
MFKTYTLILAALIAGPLCASSVSALTFYVDKNNAQCADTPGAGTSTRPYCTLRYVTTIANPGDVFLIRRGKYGEGGEFTRSGTASAPIVYRAADANVTIGSFNDVRDEDFVTTPYANVYSIPWTQTCCTNYKISQTYFPPILVDDPNSSRFTMRQEDGVLSLQPVFDFATLSAREGTWFHSGGRIYVHTYGNRRPSTTTTDLVIGHRLNGLFRVATNVSYNVFDGFTLSYGAQDSFLVFGSVNQFLNLRFQGLGFFLSGTRNYVENVSVSHVINRGETWEWHYSAQGTSMGIKGTNHILKNIHLFHSWNAQIDPETSTGVLIDGLRAHGSPNHCGLMGKTSNITFRNLTMYNCQDYLWLAESDNFVIEHATIPGGIYVMAEQASMGGVIIRNSIFGGSWTFDPVRSERITCEWEEKSIMENNVISANATIKHCSDNRVYPIQEYMARCQSGQLSPCMRIRNNVMVTDFRTVIQDGLWRAALEDTWNTRLVANSPAINAARFSAAAYDIAGVARPQGSAPDSGMYEQCPASGCTTPPPVTPCDLNRDRTTNVNDIQLIVIQVLGASACTADINGDGRCNILDVQRVVNAVTTGTCSRN